MLYPEYTAFLDRHPDPDYSRELVRSALADSGAVLPVVSAMVEMLPEISTYSDYCLGVDISAFLDYLNLEAETRLGKSHSLTLSLRDLREPLEDKLICWAAIYVDNPYN